MLWSTDENYILKWIKTNDILGKKRKKKEAVIQFKKLRNPFIVQQK